MPSDQLSLPDTDQATTVQKLTLVHNLDEQPELLAFVSSLEVSKLADFPMLDKYHTENFDLHKIDGIKLRDL